VHTPLSSKPQTRAKRLLHTDWITLWLHRQNGPNELFATKGIQTLDLIKMSPRPRHLPLESTPWGYTLPILLKSTNQKVPLIFQNNLIAQQKPTNTFWSQLNRLTPPV